MKSSKSRENSKSANNQFISLMRAVVIETNELVRELRKLGWSGDPIELDKPPFREKKEELLFPRQMQMFLPASHQIAPNRQSD